MKDEEAESKSVIERAFRSGGLECRRSAKFSRDRKSTEFAVRNRYLVREKALVKIVDELVFHRDALEDLRKRMAQEKAE